MGERCDHSIHNDGGNDSRNDRDANDARGAVKIQGHFIPLQWVYRSTSLAPRWAAGTEKKPQRSALAQERLIFNLFFEQNSADALKADVRDVHRLGLNRKEADESRHRFASSVTKAVCMLAPECTEQTSTPCRSATAAQHRTPAMPCSLGPWRRSLALKPLHLGDTPIDSVAHIGDGQGHSV